MPSIRPLLPSKQHYNNMREQHFDKHHKVVLVGESTVGKTQLINRFTKDKFVREQGTTQGIEIASRSMTVDGVSVHVQIWDTCGQEQYRCVAAPYFRDAMGALAVYDVTNRKSFLALPYWVKEVRNRSPHNVTVLVVGNKVDLEGRREVTPEEGKSLAESLDAQAIETSALSGINVNVAFNLLMKKVCERAVLGHSKNSVSLHSRSAADGKNCRC